MSDMFFGVLFAILGMALLFCSAMVGYSLAEDRFARECKTFGKTEIRNSMIECKQAK
jgi:hypothetical protein